MCIDLGLVLFYFLKENCEEKTATVVVEEEILLAKNGDSSLISEAMAQEEEQLLKIREDEETAKRAAGSGEAPDLNDTQFTKLDELLTQTQLYSEFLLEKMEDITKVKSSSCWLFTFVMRVVFLFLMDFLCFARMG